MEHPFSTSKVTVEYFDPHGVYKLLGPGLVPRLPLRNLHWQSHAGPLRSIDVLFVELVDTGADPTTAAPHNTLRRSVSASVPDDGFQTQQVGGKSASTDNIEAPTAAQQPGKERRHQIPGLRRTPYLKVLLVRCDDNDTYKATTRAEIRDWIKQHTPPSQSTRKVNNQENHDAFEWLIVHVVVPNTVAATQPRTSGKSAEGASSEKATSSRWRTGSSTLLEKMRADFNVTGKGAADRIAQIRIGINDVPYDILPRVVPATPTGYSETEKDAELAWQELLARFRSLILASFDMRVTQYEDDIREKDAQRLLPGWNFCTFFILKEGLARGFESVGLVEDALVGYDELSVGLDSVIHEQVVSGDAERNGGALLGYTEELKKQAERAIAAATGSGNVEDEESVDLQSKERPASDHFDEIPISSTKKLYRDMIVGNNVSVFDFRCYIFGRQLALLLRSGNAWSSKEELLAKLKEQQEGVLHGVAPQAPAPKLTEDAENLTMLGEICRRTLQFIPAISQVMRADIISAIGQASSDPADQSLNPMIAEIVDNLVASFAFSVAQQILAQTSTKSLPIPPSLLAAPEIHEPKTSIPEPKTMMHPARTTSLHVRTATAPPLSPGIFPGPGAGQRASVSEGVPIAPNTQFLKNGLEELAARRAELYNLSRNVLEECGKKRGWGDGWASVPEVGDSGLVEMVDISLDDNDAEPTKKSQTEATLEPLLAGIEGRLLQAALDNKEDFYRLYETLTDKALRHYTVADHNHAVQASMADLAILKYHLNDYAAAASYFYRVTPFFGETGWSLLELSMLIMYADCLQELQRKDEYVRVVLKLLTKAAVAQKERLTRRSGFRLGAQQDVEHPSSVAIKGFLGKLLDVTKTFSNEVPVPLGQMFSNPQLDECPEYDDSLDSFTLTIKLRSLLVDDLTIETARMRLTSSDPGIPKELWLECTTPQTLKPGESTIRLHSKTSVSGRYDVDRLSLTSNNVHLHYERDIDHDSSKGTDAFHLPQVTLCRQEGGLDCQLTAARHTQLDRNNCLDLKLLTGWNDVKSCEVRIRPSTGGLRLLSTEAHFVGTAFEYAAPLEPGSFRFGAVAPNTTVQLRFPFSTEQDVANISVKIEVFYTTENGTYTFSTVPSIPVSLALGVNVQDVFKHNAIFSRFSVSTASPSPITVFKSELQHSDIFESHFGVAPDKPVVVFPKQPASLLYKITRKNDVPVQPKTQKTLYLKLHYSVVLDEIVSTVSSLLKQAILESDLARYSTLLVAHIHKQVPAVLSLYDLERAGLLSEISTAFLTRSGVGGSFTGLGKLPGSDKDAARAIVAFLQDWQRTNPKLDLKPSENIEDTQSILIPVDVPSIPILYTIDIQLDKSLPSPIPYEETGTPIAGVNQLLSANLQLKWTRNWDTSAGIKDKTAAPQEFTYDVTAPPDTWLLGGRKRGRIAVPAPGADTSSSPDQSTMNIPLIMVPLREGWLPYPSVDIREAKAEEEGLPPSQGHCETDFRNLGETVRVIADREKVTLSLDSSGPGGGPLVVESERRPLEGRIVV